MLTCLRNINRIRKPETPEQINLRKIRDRERWQNAAPEQKRAKYLKLAEHQTQVFYLPEHKRRVCLYCDCMFDSLSPFNRRCDECEQFLKKKLFLILMGVIML